PGRTPDLASWLRERGGRDGQRFLIGPDGYPDLRINAFLASAKMRNLADLTNRDYAYSLALWLNFLLTCGRRWWEATEEDAEEFQFWRLTDPGNGRTVETSAFSKDFAACKKFYRWAGRKYQVDDPFEDMEAPRGKRQENVKWLDPAAVARWRDVGLRGRGLDGRADGSWRGRNEQRDTAFFDGLYGTGLRVSSWASVVLPELPRIAPGRGYFTCALADKCAKGRYGYRYWMPRAVLTGTSSYREGARARAVRQAQREGRYASVPGRRVVIAAGRTSVTLEGGRGVTVERPWNLVPPPLRRKLFRETVHGLEPLALWLNEDGLPRAGHGWQHTFTAGNHRVKQLGLQNFTCTAHMLRHSAALKWFAVGKLVSARRLAHLTDDELRDFRTQFGMSGTWCRRCWVIAGWKRPRRCTWSLSGTWRSSCCSLMLRVSRWAGSWLRHSPAIRGYARIPWRRAGEPPWTPGSADWPRASRQPTAFGT
ncbi:site-specific integrase, partial [Streptomyces sp. NPDC048491]|uniref:site-specific integrase n=1 Tax=Streptomyces sp. NPDC048491 TaxID=3157207 RepID=UPI003437D656